MSTDIVLSVRGLKKYYPIESGMLRRVTGHVKAVDDVSFELARGEVLALVGESGCGKTTLGRSIIRAIDPTAGSATLRVDGEEIDLASADRSTLRRMRRHMNMVFQDPFSSLSPRMSVRDIVGEPLRAQGVPAAEIARRVEEMAQMCGLNPSHLSRYPNAFSGGQRQRVCIARALITNPVLIVADEPVSALDVSIRAQVLDLFAELNQKLGVAYLFITHDLTVARAITDEVMVMHDGKIVETGRTDEVLDNPQSDAAKDLVAAAPDLKRAIRRRMMEQG